MSKQLERAMDECMLQPRCMRNELNTDSPVNMFSLDLPGHRNVSNRNSAELKKRL